MIALTKIVLPTIDIVTDLLLTVQLITGLGFDLTCGEYFAEYHVNMGLAYITPAVISALLHMHHWYHFEKVENGGSGRQKTFVLAACQLWVPYRYAKFIGIVEKDVEKSERANAFLDRELASIKPGVESVPQLLIVVYIFFTSPKCFGATQAISFTTLNMYYK